MKNRKRVFDLLEDYVLKSRLNDVYAYKYTGNWRKYSAQESVEIINQLSCGLLKLGIKKDDKVAIISPSRPEWSFVDFALQQLGAVTVPVYPTASTEDFRYIFNDARTVYAFVEDEILQKKVEEASEGLDFFKGIYVFSEAKNTTNWKEVAILGEKENFSQLEPYKNAVHPDDLLTIIYTSGTTGTPKGVMLTHNNIVSNVEGSLKYFNTQDIGDGKALSFLPMCHIFERVVVYVYLRKSISIYFGESLEKIGENIKEIQPIVFTAVPRLLEKIYDKIIAKGAQLTGIKRKLFFWAVDLGLRYDPTENMGFWYNFQLQIARKLVFSKWVEALGGKVQLIMSGSAALQTRLIRIFWAAGIPIAEGYGLTETSPVISANQVRPLDIKIGSVGTLIEDVEVKIAEDGWFHTGDIGEMVEGRFLKITDRKKELLKTSGGKYIAPQKLENRIKESIYIEQVVVVGDGQKFPGALVIPNFDSLKEYCQKNNIDFSDNATIIKNQKVKEFFESEVARLMEEFGQYERVKKIELLPHVFTVDTGEVTPTLKLKRRIISTKYKNEIDRIYR